MDELDAPITEPEGHQRVTATVRLHDALVGATTFRLP
jgi:hypothetical protein